MMGLGFLPEASVLLVYTIACAVLFLTPGPDMSLFLSRTITGGRSSGIAAMLGASAGCLVHTLLAGLGLSALLAASQGAFTALKIVGAVYLFWLAVDAIRSGATLRVNAGAAAGKRAPRFWPTFLTGVGVNLSNPKVVLFFVTFLPQFVNAGDPEAGAKLIFLGIYYVLFSVPLAIALILVAERFIEIMRANPRVLRALDYTFAGVFGFFAIKILAAEAPGAR